jgi:hypothetical protein
VKAAGVFIVLEAMQWFFISIACTVKILVFRCETKWRLLKATGVNGAS